MKTYRRLNRKCRVATGGFTLPQTAGLFTLTILAALWLCGMLPIVQ